MKKQNERMFWAGIGLGIASVWIPGLSQFAWLLLFASVLW